MKLSQFLALMKALMPGVDVTSAISKNNTTAAAAFLSANLTEGVANPLITSMNTAAESVVLANIAAKATELGITFIPEA